MAYQFALSRRFAKQRTRCEEAAIVRCDGVSLQCSRLARRGWTGRWSRPWRDWRRVLLLQFPEAKAIRLGLTRSECGLPWAHASSGPTSWHFCVGGSTPAGYAIRRDRWLLHLNDDLHVIQAAAGEVLPLSASGKRDQCLKPFPRAVFLPRDAQKSRLPSLWRKTSEAARVMAA